MLSRRLRRCSEISQGITRRGESTDRKLEDIRDLKICVFLQIFPINSHVLCFPPSLCLFLSVVFVFSYLVVFVFVLQRMCFSSLSDLSSNFPPGKPSINFLDHMYRYCIIMAHCTLFFLNMCLYQVQAHVQKERKTCRATVS